MKRKNVRNTVKRKTGECLVSTSGKSNVVFTAQHGTAQPQHCVATASDTTVTSFRDSCIRCICYSFEENIKKHTDRKGMCVYLRLNNEYLLKRAHAAKTKSSFITGSTGQSDFTNRLELK